VLLELRDEHPMVELLIERRKWAKQESTYTRPWVNQILTTRQRRIYPNYNITGTVTGRLSSNLQQIPRDNFIRGIITAPKGWTLIEADFSQIELRIAAMVSHDPAMMAVYQRGEDLHTLMASAITGKPPEFITKEERSRAKAANFGFIYGMGWRNFGGYARQQFGIVVTPEQAQHYRTSFFLRFPGLVNWHDSQRRQAQVLGYVDSPIGRRRRVPAVRSADKEMRAEAERQAINSPVQGFASDLTLMAMKAFDDAQHSQLLDSGQVRLLGNVHDSLLFEATDDYAPVVAPQIKMLMETLPIEELFGYTPPVPIVADVSLVKHWGGA
jgi:DNA polymerase I-like protein with 3'-5' exonuclease and polymerase domains